MDPTNDLAGNEAARGDAGKEPSDKDQALIEEIREDFAHLKSYWADNRKESEADMRCIACIPPSDFTDDRKGRPCIWPDEISQYVKQNNNNLRQNKRSIKLSPVSDNATDQDAQHRQAYIRGIEYASNAQAIYQTGVEAAAESAFGYWRVTTMVTGPNGEQEPRLRRIPNQFTVYMDSDAREADYSDGNICFVLDSMRLKTFLAKYPKAKKRSFAPADTQEANAGDWLQGDEICVAEYWKRKTAETSDGEKIHKVTQYITNGFEILETNDWIGSWIPIVCVSGEEIYLREEGKSKRMVLSLIRRARGPQTMLAYIASQEAEEIGMAPRAPLQGYEGQFNSQLHKNIHKEPRAYIEFKIPKDWNPTWGPPPLPSRAAFSPNLQAYEMAYERYRRAIQASMGVGNLPTDAQRQNQKSGVALERIENQQATGSFHITDNFVRALGYTGRQLDELITKLAELDSLPKQVLGKDQKDEDMTLKVQPQGTPTNTGEAGTQSEHLQEADQFFAHRGKFGVTISDGPSYQSQREEASSLADTLLETLPQMGLPPAITQQILAIAVKLKNIGTYGDEIADLLSPPDPNNIPPQAKALLAQAQGQVQQLTQEVQELRLKQLGKVTEIQGRMQLAQQDGAARMAEADKDRETKLAVAEVMTKAQSIDERLNMVMDLMKQMHSQAHDLALSLGQQQHEKAMAQSAAANAQLSQSSDQAHQQNMSTQAQQQEPAAGETA